ncbi:hypothetical protein SK128_010367 [Halocaridina rubra]|uniref:NADP-dependent oxidoreductase domain-containing protein n=1 Tax=Halocaridina rubra TaxID=373956 RepID=A0AAN8WNQ1_HALRR
MLISQKQVPKMPMLLQNPTVISIANRLGKTPAQVLLRFLVQLGTAAIPMSSSPDRIRQNLQLSGSDVSALEALDQGTRGKTFPFDDRFQG